MTEALLRHQRLALLLVEARRSGRQLRGLAPDLVPATAEDGYLVNALVTEGLGWAPLGWKIAGTNSEMRLRLRTAEPIRGRSYARFETALPARFHHAELLDPIVECEFMFRIGCDLPARATPYTKNEIAEAVAAVHVGVEVAECRFPLDRLPPMPAILADGAANGRYVVGPAIPDWRQRDLAIMPVTLEVNGAVRRTGTGAEVMGDPINAVRWLANHLPQHGQRLEAGALVSTGTTTGMLLAKAGDEMRATFDDAFAIALRFTA